MSGAEPKSNAGDVTFLFTDIEGSTRRWETDPDAMRLALAIHDALLRRTVAEHGGLMFKHTGDGVCAAFPSPHAAVDAAVDAQRALELPVRMGIATGEAEIRSGDYFGPVLNRTARIMGAGHGGQILMDGATAGRLRDSTSPCDLLDLGARRLRDIAKPVELFQVCAPGLCASFPTLRTADTTPGNLRRPTTSFIGRDAETTAVQAAIRANPMVTLTGFGGVGKTRLALERIGQYDAATTLIGFSVSEMTLATFPEMATTIRHLREVLGETTYEVLASTGANMTNAGIAQFAFEHIERALSRL